MTTSSALPQIDETLLATTRYLQALTVLDDESAAAALGAARLVPRARRGPPVPQRRRLHPGARAGAAGRAGVDVRLERGAGRATSRRPSRATTSPAWSRTRCRPSARLTEALLGVRRRPGHAVHAGAGGEPSSRWTRSGRAAAPRWRSTTPTSTSATQPADWPPDFSSHVVRQRQDELAALPDGGPSMVLVRHRRRRALEVRRRARGRRSTAPPATWPGGWSAAAAGRGLTCSSRRSCRPSEGGDELSRQGQPRRAPRTSGSSPELTITKFSVSEMDNNVYLLRCRPTDEQVLVDAADDAAPDPRRSSATAACAGWSPPTSTGTTTARWPRWSGATGAETVAGAEDADELPVPVDRRVARRRRRRGRRLPARGDPPRRPHPRLDRAAVRRPRRHPAPVHRRLASSRAASARPGPRRTSRR